MRIVRRSHHNQINFRIAESISRRSQHADARPILLHHIRLRRNNMREPQSANARNQRRMKHLSRHSIPNHRNIQLFRFRRLLSRRQAIPPKSQRPKSKKKSPLSFSSRERKSKLTTLARSSESARTIWSAAARRRFHKARQASPEPPAPNSRPLARIFNQIRGHNPDDRAFVYSTTNFTALIGVKSPGPSLACISSKYSPLSSFSNGSLNATGITGLPFCT